MVPEPISPSAKIVAVRSATETADAIRRREVRAVEALGDARHRIEQTNDELIAFVHLDWELAQEAAREVDRQIDLGGDPGPLAGVPFGVKDLDDCAGMPTSHGSLIFKGSTPKAEDSPHVARLRQAGAVPVGKTAPSEFGMDSATTTRAWGVTRNPWRQDRTPGGSSGGSAAAVAAGMVPFSTSSDLGGSTRTPASFTGLVGLKPSQGRIPQRPSPTDLGMHGVVTRTVADTARALDVMAGPWPSDVMSLPRPAFSYEKAIEELDVKGLRVAWSADLGFAGVEKEVEAVARGAAARLIEAARLELMTDRPSFTEPGPIIFNIEFPRWIYDLTKQGIWPEKKDLLSRAGVWAADFGLSVGFEAFLEAELDLVKVRRELGRFFQDHDVLMTPTVACRAYGADDPYPTEVEGHDVTRTTIEPFTQLSTLGWLPSVSVPAGMSSDGLPIGLQIVGPPHRDEVVLRLARILEVVEPWPLTAAL
jgi:aspartyl-tRNA(Asn)/glutamyl-tRNA(Gln) amidotransferase subunit A